jgi:hypothetical protein
LVGVGISNPIMRKFGSAPHDRNFRKVVRTVIWRGTEGDSQSSVMPSKNSATACLHATVKASNTILYFAYIHDSFFSYAIS